MPERDVKFRVDQTIDGIPYNFEVTIKREPPPIFPPSFPMDHHVECYLPKKPDLTLFLKG